MKLLDELVALRRYLHQNPELSFQEYKTQEFILGYFKNKKCECYKIKTSTIIYFENNKKETLAFRSEEDALPIVEKNNLEFKSRNNCMHACGHDGHMAMLLKLGDYIENNLSNLRYNYLLIFEAGEELTGSVDLITNSEIYIQHLPKYVFGLHLFPFNKKEGTIFTASGPFLSKCVEINIEVKGKASHVVNKGSGIDALLILNVIYNKIYNFLNSINDVRFLFGKMIGGKQRNIVADYALLQGTIRFFDNEIFEYIKEEIDKIIKEMNQNISVIYNDKFEFVSNDRNLLRKIQSHSMVELTDKLYIGETFGLYGKKSKINYALLSIKSSSLHSEDFNFDEKVLVNGYWYLVSLLTL